MGGSGEGKWDMITFPPEVNYRRSLASLNKSHDDIPQMSESVLGFSCKALALVGGNDQKLKICHFCPLVFGLILYYVMLCYKVKQMLDIKFLI